MFELSYDEIYWIKYDDPRGIRSGGGGDQIGSGEDEFKDQPSLINKLHTCFPVAIDGL